jgi:hypothetical protein
MQEVAGYSEGMKTNEANSRAHLLFTVCQNIGLFYYKIKLDTAPSPRLLTYVGRFLKEN